MIALLNATSGRIPLADKSVHCVVTSPPYFGLRSYGLPPRVWGGKVGCRHVWENASIPGRGSGGPSAKQDSNAGSRFDNPSAGQFCQRCGAWRGCLGLEPLHDCNGWATGQPCGMCYVCHIVEVFREVWRVLRDDGVAWVNLGDSYASQPSWGRGGGSTLGGGKPHSAGVRRNMSGLKSKDLIGIPWRVALALQADGWYLRSDIIWAKKNPMPESVTDRPAKAHEYLFLLSKNKRYFYDADAVRERTGNEASWDAYSQADGRVHFHEADLEKGMSQRNPAYKGMTHPAGRNRRTVWTISTRPYKGSHFATYPPALVEPCIKAGTSECGVCPGCGAPWQRMVKKNYGPDTSSTKHIAGGDQTIGQGWEGAQRRALVTTTTTGWQPTCTCNAGDPISATVLDPFVGSGTTLLVARRLGRSGVGLDLSFDYLSQQARKRLELDKLAAWGNGGGNLREAILEGLPLFGALTKR